MAYVLNIYYIGPMSQYDGDDGTDIASTYLFSKKDTAINYAIKFLNDATNDEIDPKNPYIKTKAETKHKVTNINILSETIQLQ